MEKWRKSGLRATTSRASEHSTRGNQFIRCAASTSCCLNSLHLSLKRHASTSSETRCTTFSWFSFPQPEAPTLSQEDRGFVLTGTILTNDSEVSSSMSSRSTVLCVLRRNKSRHRVPKDVCLPQIRYEQPNSAITFSLSRTRIGNAKMVSESCSSCHACVQY
jgi:hypothetical protein